MLDSRKQAWRQCSRRQLGEIDVAWNHEFKLRCGQLFDKETALDHAQWVQIGFIKQIVVVGVFGSQRRIADTDRRGTGRIVLRDVWDELIWIGTGHAARVHRAEVGVRSESIAQLLSLIHISRRQLAYILADTGRTVEKLRTLNTLLEMTKEAEDLASKGEQMERIKTLIAEIRRKAQKEYERTRGDQGRGEPPNPTRYELCMIGIREEFGRGSKSNLNMPALRGSLGRIQEEIHRTINEIKARHQVM